MKCTPDRLKSNTKTGLLQWPIRNDFANALWISLDNVLEEITVAGTAVGTFLRQLNSTDRRNKDVNFEAKEIIFIYKVSLYDSLFTSLLCLFSLPVILCRRG